MNSARSLSLVGCAVLTSALYADCPDFNSGRVYDLGHQAKNVQMGDLNGDAVLDVVVTTFSNDGAAASVFLGVGDGYGTLQAIEGITGISSADSLAMADLNSDGKLDIVIGSQGASPAVAVFRGNGDGTFQPSQTINLVDGTRALALGDFDGDSKLDVAVGHNSTSIDILPGNGDATFGLPAAVAVGAPSVSIAVADLNADGKLDLVVANGSGFKFSTLLGNGDGTFGAPAPYAQYGGPVVDVKTADFNLDGKPDVAAALYNGNEPCCYVFLFLGNGDGTLGGGGSVSFNDAYSPQVMALADFNGDGALDIAVTEKTVDIIFGDATGHLAAPVPYLAGYGPYGVATGDVNGDGIPDVATANFDGTLSILLGKGDGSLQAPGTHFFAGPLASADFDGDGDKDLAIVAGFQPGHPILYTVQGLGNGSFAYFFQQTGFDAAGVNNIVSGDFNGDRKADVAISLLGSEIAIGIGNGNGGFGVTKMAAGGATFDLAVADLDGNGIDDLVSANTDNSVTVFVASGGGAFQPPTVYAAGIQPRTVVAQDFDGDRRPDVVVGNAGSNFLSYFHGNGDGTLAPAVNLPLSAPGLAVASGFFNADNHRDLAVSTGSTVLILLGNGDGTFTGGQTIPLALGYGVIRVADFNGDGRSDLVGGTVSGRTFSILHGNGDGTFTGSAGYLLEPDPYYLIVDDFTSDGLPDVASAGAILLNARAPAPPITTASSQPIFGTGTASVPDHPGSTYNWTLTGGTITSGQGTSQIQFEAGSAGTRMTLAVTETAGGCSSAIATKSVMVDFLDVPPSHIFHDFIIKLANNGVTAGCGGGNYCPDDSVLRSQMAVFLLRGEHGETYAPATATGIFADVATPSFFADFIERLYNEGITGGCATNPLRYCPGNPVLRSQMAIFLLRAEHGAAYAPPPAVGIFQDVPVGSFAADFIERLYSEGITSGCSTNPPLYCPNSATTRGAMAVFLVRTFNLQ